MNVTCKSCKNSCSDDIKRIFNYDGCNQYLAVTNPIYNNLIETYELSSSINSFQQKICILEKELIEKSDTNHSLVEQLSAKDVEIAELKEQVEEMRKCLDKWYSQYVDKDYTEYFYKRLLEQTTSFLFTDVNKNYEK